MFESLLVGYDGSVAGATALRDAAALASALHARLLLFRVSEGREETGETIALALVACAREVRADLVVVAARGRRALTGSHPGSVSRSLLHLGECPVLVTRGWARAWPPLSIGLLGSVEARRGPLREAGEAFAARLGAHLEDFPPALDGPLPDLLLAGGDVHARDTGTLDELLDTSPVPFLAVPVPVAVVPV